ncbi:MAG: hypothetical protein U0168_08530 [Nannocystaceae bacterium]
MRERVDLAPQRAGVLEQPALGLAAPAPVQPRVDQGRALDRDLQRAIDREQRQPGDLDLALARGEREGAAALDLRAILEYEHLADR